MKKIFSLILIFVISISIISSLCEKGQININTASKTELEKLYLVGPVKAQAIIDARPLNSVQEILDIYGIGDKTLEGIKEQGLACVNTEIEKPEESEEVVEEVAEKEVVEEKKETGNNEIKRFKTISLTAKTIKSQDNKENKGNYAVYGFVAFCILLGVLFIIKNKKYKNEFR